MRPINADAVLVEVEKAFAFSDRRGQLAHAIFCIQNAPTIEPEVRHGHWMFLEQKSDYLWKCSNCKGNFDQRFSYCPNCGAKMDGGAENV